MKAYSYKRYSTPDQAKGLSLVRQESETEALCRRNGWELDQDLSIDDLGKSAFTKGSQKGLEAFMQAIRLKQVVAPAVLIVERLDRLSRQEIDPALAIWQEILRAGISIATVSPEMVYQPTSVNNLADLVQTLIYFSVAHDESKKKSERTCYNWDHKRVLAAKTGAYVRCKLPAWIHEQNGVLSLDPAKAKTIQKIFQMSIDGYGAPAITKHLNDSGVANIAAGYSRAAQTSWNQRYVEALLNDRKTIGEQQFYRVNGKKRTPTGEPLKEYFPAVVTADVFYSAAAARKSRFTQRGPNGPTTANLFQGILFDMGSGKPYQMVNSSVSEKKRGCFRRLSAGDLTWQYEQFEEHFLAAVKEIVLESIETKNNQSNRLPGLEAEAAVLKAKHDNLFDQLLSGPFDSGIELLRQLEIKRNQVQKEIDKAKTELTTNNTPRQFINAMDKLKLTPPSELPALRRKIRAVIRQMITRIDISISLIKNRLHRTLTCSMTFRDSRVRYFVLVSRRGVVTHFFSHEKAVQTPNLEGYGIDELISMKHEDVRCLLSSVG